MEGHGETPQSLYLVSFKGRVRVTNSPRRVGLAVCVVGLGCSILALAVEFLVLSRCTVGS